MKIIAVRGYVIPLQYNTVVAVVKICVWGSDSQSGPSDPQADYEAISGVHQCSKVCFAEKKSSYKKSS